MNTFEKLFVGTSIVLSMMTGCQDSSKKVEEKTQNEAVNSLSNMPDFIHLPETETPSTQELKFIEYFKNKGNAKVVISGGITGGDFRFMDKLGKAKDYAKENDNNDNMPVVILNQRLNPKAIAAIEKTGITIPNMKDRDYFSFATKGEPITIPTEEHPSSNHQEKVINIGNGILYKYESTNQ